MSRKGGNKPKGKQGFYNAIKEFIKGHEMTLEEFSKLAHLEKEGLDTPTYPCIQYVKDTEGEIDSEWLVLPPNPKDLRHMQPSVPLYIKKSGFGIPSEELREMITEELKQKNPPNLPEKEPPGGGLLSG